MEHFKLLVFAFLTLCVAAAWADPEPISTPFIPCKALPALKTLNMTLMAGGWVTKKLYAVSEQAASVGEQIAKPEGHQCSQQEVTGVNGLALQLAVVDGKTGNRNLSSCSINRSQHGLWTCSPAGKGPFDMVVILAEPNSYMLAASACVSAKNFPGLEKYEPARFTPVLWLFQKKDSPALSQEKVSLIDQKVSQVLQRQVIQRQIDCTRGGHGGPQGGHRGPQAGSQGGQLNDNNLNEFDDSDIGLPDRIGQGGFVNANDRDKHKHRPGVHFPNSNGNNPHVGAQGGSTVLRPGTNPQTGVTYTKPGSVAGSTGAFQGEQVLHKDPKVNGALHQINAWFNDRRNLKQNGQGGGNHGNHNNGNGGFGPNSGHGNGGNNNNNNGNDYEDNNGGDFGSNGNFGGVGFRLGGGKNLTEGPVEATSESVQPTEETETEVAEVREVPEVPHIFNHFRT